MKKMSGTVTHGYADVLKENFFGLIKSRERQPHATVAQPAKRRMRSLTSRDDFPVLPCVK